MTTKNYYIKKDKASSTWTKPEILHLTPETAYVEKLIIDKQNKANIFYNFSEYGPQSIGYIQKATVNPSGWSPIIMSVTTAWHIESKDRN